MSTSIMKSAGLAFGIMIGLILAIALILISNHNRKVRTEYDERQLRVRGDAYRYAFYSVIICEVILLILAFGRLFFKKLECFSGLITLESFGFIQKLTLDKYIFS